MQEPSYHEFGFSSLDFYNILEGKFKNRKHIFGVVDYSRGDI